MPRQITNFHERDNAYTLVVEIAPKSVDNVVFQRRGPIVNVVGQFTAPDGQQKKFNINRLRLPDDANVEDSHVHSNNHILTIDIPRDGHTLGEDGSLFDDMDTEYEYSYSDEDEDGNSTDSEAFNFRYFRNGELSETVVSGESIEHARELFVQLAPDGVSEDDIESVVPIDGGADNDDSDDNDEDGDDDDDDDGVGGAEKIVK